MIRICKFLGLCLVFSLTAYSQQSPADNYPELSRPNYTMTRQQIDATGLGDLSQLLKSSFLRLPGHRSGTATFTGEFDIAGLGSDRTSILLNGNQIVGSGYIGGGFQRAETIPLDSIERIDFYLRDMSFEFGPGSAAGAVNIVTREAWEGLDLKAGYTGREYSDGDITSLRFSAGKSVGKGNIRAYYQHDKSDAIFDREIDSFATPPDSGHFSAYGFPAGYYAYSWPGQYRVDPRCPAGLGESAQFPNAYRWRVSDRQAYVADETGVLCGYNYAADTTYSPETRGDNLLLEFNYLLNLHMEFNGQVSINRRESGHLMAPDLVRFHMDAGNPLNPTNALAARGELPEPADITGYFRTVPMGLRDIDSQENNLDLVLQLESPQLEGDGFWWQVKSQFQKRDYDYRLSNIADPGFAESVNAGMVDIFNMAGRSHGDWHAHLQQALQPHGKRQDIEIDYERQHGEINLGWNRQLAEDRLMTYGLSGRYAEIVYDREDSTGSGVICAAPPCGSPNDGDSRRYYSLTGTLGYPVTSSLDAAFQYRYIRFDEFDASSAPKVVLDWRFSPEWRIGFAWSRSKSVPGFLAVNQEAYESSIQVIDSARCEVDDSVCNPIAARVVGGGDRDLDRPEEQRSLGVRLDWQPNDAFHLSLDYLDHKINNAIVRAHPQNQLHRERDGVFHADVGRNWDGSLSYIGSFPEVLDTVTSKALLASLSLQSGTGRFGEISGRLDLYRQLELEKRDDRFRSDREFEGSIGSPDTRAEARVVWSLDKTEVNWLSRFIGENGDPEQDYGKNGSWTSHDLQIAYALPWQGKIRLGANNLFDREPPMNADVYGWRPIDRSLYQSLGRSWYVYYEQSFR